MTTTSQQVPQQPSPGVADQAPIPLGLLAGYVGTRAVQVGLRHGLLAALAEEPGDAETVAGRLDLDPFYVATWLRSAIAAGICERDGEAVRLAPHMATLLLDTTSPAYVGAVFTLFGQREIFDRFSYVLGSGERLWWSDTSPEWIAAVAGTGTPFYTRLVPAGLDHVPGLAERLGSGCTVVDTACGVGVGLLRLAAHYPACRLLGVDGDAHSLELAAGAVREAGVDQRVRLVHSALEEMDVDEPATVVINNISMHECRDADAVTRNVLAALEPGGWFVISDLPFPDSDEGLRTPAGRIMSGIQYFEAQIDDQLLPRRAYDELLARHGFTDLGSAQLTPMHALTWGRAPGRG